MLTISGLAHITFTLQDGELQKEQLAVADD